VPNSAPEPGREASGPASRARERFRRGDIGVPGGFGFERGDHVGAGVVEVRLVNGGLGRIGPFKSRFPLIDFLRRSIGLALEPNRLGIFGGERRIVLLLRFLTGFDPRQIFDRFFKGGVGRRRLVPF
jgi:hypothetical protein